MVLFAQKMILSKNVKTTSRADIKLLRFETNMAPAPLLGIFFLGWVVSRLLVSLVNTPSLMHWRKVSGAEVSDREH